ncbi:MAG: PQQ-like beta-propeller repeat protein [Lentisphaerae bacterium]|nr:PQQ-like beta-propeller repeat protein [Lentisphaerota bacterium]
MTKRLSLLLLSFLLVDHFAFASNSESDSATDGKATAPEVLFKDHGIVVPIAECRGVYVYESSNSAYAVATSLDRSPRGWILFADLNSKKVEQINCPDNVRNSPPYESVMGSNGKFYTSQGGMFLEFDLETKTWTFQKRASGASAILSMAEGPDGTIWMGNVYQSGLHSFNPVTREFKDYGRMDDRETYLQSMGFDREGWVYVGVGTARENLVAFNPATGERIQLADESKRKTGNAKILTDPKTGDVFAIVHGERFGLLGGKATPVDRTPGEKRFPGYRSRPELSDGRLVSFSFASRLITLKAPDGSTQTIEFDYKTSGAPTSNWGITAGPDGRIYINSTHPSYMAYYDPAKDELNYFRDPWAQQCLGVQGNYVFGGRYTGGLLKVFDTTKPWNRNPGEGEKPNPFVAIPSSRPNINRPIVAFPHPDGEHILITGMPGYGRTGGGMSIYNLKTGKTELYTHEDLITNYTITTLDILPDGRLVGGTTVSGTHGGHAIEKTAVIFTYDWDSRKVIWKTAPIENAGNIAMMKALSDGRLLCSAPGGKFFVYDLNKEEIIYTSDMSAFGGATQIFILEGTRALLTARNSVFEFDTDTFHATKIADSPTGIGRSAVMDGRLYFLSGPRLFSCNIPKGIKN